MNGPTKCHWLTFLRPIALLDASLIGDQRFRLKTLCRCNNTVAVANTKAQRYKMLSVTVVEFDARARSLVQHACSIRDLRLKALYGLHLDCF